MIKNIIFEVNLRNNSNSNNKTYKMKIKYLLLLLFFCTCAFSQTMTEKYNSYLNRYEYFDSYGNLTGYKSYNSYTGVWEYYSENANSNNRKPIEYAKPQTDDNFALLQQVANQKQNSYNSNHKRVQECFATIQTLIDAKDLELRVRTQNRFNSEVFNVVNNEGYDYSNNSLTNQVIKFIKDKYMEILLSESKKLNDEIESKNKLIETEKNTSVRESVLSKSLTKFIGNYKVYKIEDYIKTSSGKWTLSKTDNSIANLTLTNSQIIYKRNSSLHYKARELFFTDYDSGKGYYIYDSNYGITFIEKDFKTVIFYDKDNDTKKYVYYVKK